MTLGDLYGSYLTAGSPLEKRITNHAVARFIERILGYDVDCIRADLDRDCANDWLVLKVLGWKFRLGGIRKLMADDIRAEIALKPKKAKQISKKSGHINTDMALYVFRKRLLVTVVESKSEVSSI